MNLEVLDKPGQLVGALQPISELGGNIISVIHEREPGVKSDTLDVQIMLELPEDMLSSLLEIYKVNNVNVVRVGEERLLIRRSVILIGHLMHTDLSDTVDRIDATGFAEVGELSVLMPAINEPSSAKITVKCDNLDDIEKALRILNEIASEKGFMIIEPLEELA